MADHQHDRLKPQPSPSSEAFDREAKGELPAQARFTIPIDVRFRDIDGMGHINNAVYSSYIEHCRTHFFRRSGLSERLGGHHIPMILARTEIDFLRPGFLSDQISVTGWFSRLGTKSFDMMYTVDAASRGQLARARAVMVWFDYNANQSVVIPDWARQILNHCLVSHSGAGD